MKGTVYLIDGKRTPFLKAKGCPGPLSALDLSLACARPLCQRYPDLRDHINQVIWGCVMPAADEANIARLIGMRLGLPENLPAWTVQRNCASGMQAIASAMDAIAQGDDLVLCGGVEAMSHAPLLWPKAAVSWLCGWQQARGLKQCLALLRFRLSMLRPEVSLRTGLTDTLIGLNMGQTAEHLADVFGITREQMDAFALSSHEKTLAARDTKLHDCVPLLGATQAPIVHDTGVRGDSSMTKMGKLQAIFEPPFGAITAGNSAQVSDGAVALLLASEQAVERYQLPVLAKILDYQWAGCDPKTMGLGPVYATTPLLRRHGLQLKDIGVWEINEAFAAQVLACRAAWASESFCQEKFGLSAAMGELPEERLNMAGGAVAIGHPVGASGARIVLQCARLLQHHDQPMGVATLCIGGGQGGAMLMESVKEGQGV